MQAFFNAVSDSSFPEVVEHLAKSIGWHVEICHCEFPGGVELGEPAFEGVRFGLMDEEVIVSRMEFVSVLRAAVASQEKRVPSQSARLRAALQSLER